MELVYPVYLDTPMMTAFLASLEGGIAEEANIESKTIDSSEKSKKGSFGFKISELLSSVIGANAQADFSKKVSDSLESQYKSTIRFPNAALFIRLRNLLVEQNLIKKVNSKNIDEVSVGDIIEIQGLAKPAPSYELRNIVNQLMPVTIPALKLQEMQIENEKSNLNDIQGTKNIKGEKILKIQGEEDINLTELSKLYDLKIQGIQKQSLYLQEVANALNILFPEEHSSNILFDSEDFRSVCKLYPTFARDERIQDVFYAEWRCTAKVVGKISSDERYDLFKGLPIGLFAEDIFEKLKESIKSDELDINVSNPVIQGPALVLAVLAIFA